ncbi:DUF1178 family protein [Sphingomonas sp. KC8]|uniref:DUF1178 family protein n=1 Tax=Sphingomonas sp. KC8 TaxID=1030157 RepID=UPI00030E04FB|nr:DUF1178 family protein [Sphingomonas sp. KC8]ARS25806.1 hypothetical protein KC8_00660 [Sphingomonas sp. KC8]
MIVFDLACGSGHVFEGWFGSTEDFDSQRARGLLTCPMCGAADVAKAVMAPRVAAKGNQRSEAASVPLSSDGPEKLRKVMHALAEAQARALDGSDYVGERFADEARAMHLGESEHRAIHGQASVDEARALVDEGVAIAPLPFPVRPPGTDN